MKRLIAALTAIAISIAPLYAANHLYGRSVVVTDITDDMVTVLDLEGYEWQFEGSENWQVNDIATLVMFDNNTTAIFDDIIITATCCGYDDVV